MRVGAVQLAAGPDRSQNLDRAALLVGEAVDAGADFVVLPEMFSLMAGSTALRESAEDLAGPTLSWAADRAGHHGVTLVAGSFMERIDGDTRVYNTSCVLDPSGTITAVYRKIHLFDNDVTGAAYRESDTVAPGSEIVCVDVEGVLVGLTLCYDLRFPELHRILALRGARVIVVPSAFTARTGADHWEPLLRARAIENGVFVVAADQDGPGLPGIPLHGHSMILDPWGTTLASAPPGPGVVVADVDLARQDDTRSRLPSLENRRPEAYRWP